MRRTSPKNHFTYATFSRAVSNGRPIAYVRFIDTDSGEIIATRSTGTKPRRTQSDREGGEAAHCRTPRRARPRSDSKARDKAHAADQTDDERLADMSVYDFVNWFWAMIATTLVLPERTNREHGILTEEEVRKIVAPR